MQNNSSTYYSNEVGTRQAFFFYFSFGKLIQRRYYNINNATEEILQFKLKNKKLGIPW
jgi:hypothetical protein